MYTMYMALHINNPVVEQKVRDMALTTGESITEAIGAAADERIVRLRPTGVDLPSPTVDEILELIRSFKLQPINSELTDDEILGYGPDGICQ
jgi:antitoxin VapB